MKKMLLVLSMIATLLGGCSLEDESIMSRMEKMDPLKVPEYRASIQPARLTKLFQMSTRNNAIQYAMTSRNFYVTIDDRLEVYSIPDFRLSRTFRFAGLGLCVLGKDLDVGHSLILSWRNTTGKQVFDGLDWGEAMFICIREEDLSIAWRLRVKDGAFAQPSGKDKVSYASFGGRSYALFRLGQSSVAVDLATGKKHIQDGVVQLSFLAGLGENGLFSVRNSETPAMIRLECRDREFRILWAKPKIDEERFLDVHQLDKDKELFFAFFVNGKLNLRAIDRQGREVWKMEVQSSDDVFFDQANSHIVRASRTRGGSFVELSAFNPADGSLVWLSEDLPLSGKGSYAIVPDTARNQIVCHSGKTFWGIDLFSGDTKWKSGVEPGLELAIFPKRDDFIVSGGRLYFSVAESARLGDGSRPRTEIAGRKGYSINVSKGGDFQRHDIAPDFAWYGIVFSIDGSIARFDHRIWWVDKSEVFAISLDDVRLHGRFLIDTRLGTVIDLAKWLIVPSSGLPKKVSKLEVVYDPEEGVSGLGQEESMFQGLVFVASGQSNGGTDGCLQVWSLK